MDPQYQRDPNMHSKLVLRPDQNIFFFPEDVGSRFSETVVPVSYVPNYTAKKIVSFLIFTVVRPSNLTMCYLEMLQSRGVFVSLESSRI
jgi:hypothetical protein